MHPALLYLCLISALSPWNPSTDQLQPDGSGRNCWVEPDDNELWDGDETSPYIEYLFQIVASQTSGQEKQ